MTETVTIDFAPGRRPVSGSVTAGARPARPFIGWLELLALLENALAEGEDMSVTTAEEGP